MKNEALESEKRVENGRMSMEKERINTFLNDRTQKTGVKINVEKWFQIESKEKGSPKVNNSQFTINNSQLKKDHQTL